MIRTKEQLTQYTSRYIKQNFNEQITGPILNRLLIDIIDTLFSMGSGTIGELIKAPGNISALPEIGDWRVRIDENYDLHKEKYTVTGWVEHELDLYDSST